MNTHSINDDESDIDALESLTTSHASSISSINSSVTTINNKLSGSTSSGLKTLTTTNLDGINGILNHTTTSNLKSFVDANTNKTGITPSQASIITQNSNKLNMAVASTMKNAVDANTNRYPQFTNFKRYHPSLLFLLFFHFFQNQKSRNKKVVKRTLKRKKVIFGFCSFLKISF